MTIGNLTLEGILLLAPLAGISNRAFRLLARKYGASLCYTEMLSADALIRRQEKTFRMIDFLPDEHPIGVQLFGSSPEIIGEAVKIAHEFKPDLIDLNLGCPVKKVVRKNGGAALLKDLTLAGELMAAAVENSNIPVTVKMRTGWDLQSDCYIEVGKVAEKIGIAAVTLHPRNRNENYGTGADWSKIELLKNELSIPVIGNGDINTPQDARKMLEETGCDALMIGRAAMKNPYIFRQIRTFLDEGKLLPDNNIREKIDLALEHSRLMVEQFGERGGSMMMRKHLAWYSKGLRGGAEFRDSLKRVDSYKGIVSILTDYLDRAPSYDDEVPTE